MTTVDDVQLLHAFVARNERPALAELVRRHLAFVYSSALRQLRGDAHLAEDVTQAVFILLARRAGSIRNPNLLREWLFVSTRYAAKNALRIQARRRHHERRAAAQNQLLLERRAHMNADQQQPTWERLAPMLDEGIAKLGERDRAGVLMSFFDNKTYREVGAALGVSEEAARKRVTRAVDKLRDFFASRGVSVGSAGALVETIHLGAAGATASVVPADVALSVSAAAMGAAGVTVGAAVGGAGVATSAASAADVIAKGVSNMITWSKIKLAACAVVASTAVGGAGIAVVASAWAGEAKPLATIAAAPTQQQALESKPAVATFDDGVKVEILGVARAPVTKSSDWWNADGTPAPAVADASSSQDGDGNHFQLVVRVSGTGADSAAAWFAPVKGWSATQAMKDGKPLDDALAVVIEVDECPSIDFQCKIAAGEWETSGKNDNIANASMQNGPHGSVAFSPAYQGPDGARFTITYDLKDRQIRVVALDAQGNEHPARPGTTTSGQNFTQMNVTFGLPLDDVQEIQLQSRAFNHFATFSNLSLDPGKTTKVQVASEIRP